MEPKLDPINQEQVSSRIDEAINVLRDSEGCRATTLIGESHHKLDYKCRVAFPSNCRELFDKGGYIMPYKDEYLVILLPDQFDKLLNDTSEPDLKEAITNTAVEFRLDSDFRLLIPTTFRDKFSVASGQEVTFVGTGRLLELWNSTRYAEFESMHDYDQIFGNLKLPAHQE